MGLFLLHTLGIYMGPWSPTHPPTTPTPTPPNPTPHHPLSVDGDEEGNEIG